MTASAPMAIECACGCRDSAGVVAHEVLVALRDDDLDGAIEAGLLDCPFCPACEPGCARMMQAARDARLVALAARERHRKRAVRLEQAAAARDARRAAPATPARDALAPTLPPAAAAALARAKARAAERSKP